MYQTREAHVHVFAQVRGQLPKLQVQVLRAQVQVHVHIGAVHILYNTKMLIFLHTPPPYNII